MNDVAATEIQASSSRWAGLLRRICHSLCTSLPFGRSFGCGFSALGNIRAGMRTNGMPKAEPPPKAPPFQFGHSSFVIPSSFAIRASSFPLRPRQNLRPLDVVLLRRDLVSPVLAEQFGETLLFGSGDGQIGALNRREGLGGFEAGLGCRR